MKICVIGSSGSGKSTLSMKMAKTLDLPLHHLDVHYWKPGWVGSSRDEWQTFNKKLVANDQWIIDGHFRSTMDIRLKACDLVIFLDLPRLITTYRVIKRRIQYHNKKRPDLNEGCKELLDFEFVKYVWTFKKKEKKYILDKLYNENNFNVLHLKSRKAVRKFTKELTEFNENNYINKKTT